MKLSLVCYIFQKLRINCNSLSSINQDANVTGIIILKCESITINLNRSNDEGWVMKSLTRGEARDPTDVNHLLTNDNTANFNVHFKTITEILD